MPFTLSHFGFGLFLASLFFDYLNFWAFIFGSLLPDIEPFFLILIRKCFHCPHHGFFHSILGAIFGSFFISFLCLLLKKNLKKKFPLLTQNFSFSNLYFSSFLGYFLHIFFDSLSNRDVFLFWPFKIQPTLISKKLYFYLSYFFLFLGIFGVIIFLRKYGKRKSHKSE